MTVTGSDAEKRVLEALDADPRTQEQMIDVLYHQGVVTLVGSVSSEEARAAATQIAETQEGVQEVINDLRVEEQGPGSDDPIVMPPPNLG